MKCLFLNNNQVSNLFKGHKEDYGFLILSFLEKNKSVMIKLKFVIILKVLNPWNKTLQMRSVVQKNKEILKFYIRIKPLKAFS